MIVSYSDGTGEYILQECKDNMGELIESPLCI